MNEQKRKGLSAVAELQSFLFLELTAAEITEDHRQLPRSKRQKFRHDEALACIKRDYLGLPGDHSTPLLGAEFKTMFRLSKTRFQVHMEDVMAADIAFYQQRKNLHADDQASLEAQLLLPIKCLAYGVPSHTFMDYFLAGEALACLPFFLLADATAGAAAGEAFLLPLLDRDDMGSCLLPDGVFFC
jgi:hypothetical protein